MLLFLTVVIVGSFIGCSSGDDIGIIGKEVTVGYAGIVKDENKVEGKVI